MVESDQPASKFPISTESLSRFLRLAQRETRVPGEVNVVITSNQRMRSLNREFRGKDKPTDVLSFPVASALANGKQSLAGDIAISAEIARANAKSLGHSLEDEIRILLLHGLLHLAGYDHENDNGRMARLEQRLRVKLKLPTSLIERSNGDVDPAALGRVFDGKTHPVGSRKNITKATSEALPSATPRNGTTGLHRSTKHPAGGGRIHGRKRNARRTA